MERDKLDKLMVWRDVQLFKRHGDEGAATRLRKHGSIPDVAASISTLEPSAEDLKWTDINGAPIDPDHSWWGYAGPSSFEKAARRRGKWPLG